MGGDTFVFASAAPGGDETDTILDFDSAEGDRIDLSVFSGVDKIGDVDMSLMRDDDGVVEGSLLTWRRWVAALLN